MKQLVYTTFISVIITICSCRQSNTFTAMLDCTDSLLKTNPDSAFSILQSMEKDAPGVSKPLRMRHLLLWAQSRNKTYRSLPSRDTLQTLIDYYTDNGNERMKALYMMGCLYRDCGDARKALLYYNNAVSVVDTTDIGCDILTLSRIYGQLSELFNRQKAPIFGLKYSKIAEQLAWKAKDTLGAIIFIDHSAWSYEQLHDTNSIYKTIKKVERLYKQIGKYQEAAQCMPPLINIYLNSNNLKEAKQAIYVYEHHSGYFDADNNIKQGSENYYGLKGRYYFQTGNIDSAIFSYRKMLHYPDKINNLKDGYNGLLNIYRKLGDADSVAKYTRLAAIIADSINKTSPEKLTFTHVNYYSEHVKEINEKHNKTTQLLIFVCICTAMLQIGIIYAIIKKAKHKQDKIQKQINSVKRKSNKTEEKYLKVKDNYESTKYKYDKELQAKTQKISELEKTIYIIKKGNDSESPLTKECDENITILLNAHIDTLKKDARKGICATKGNLLKLKFLEAEHEPEFFKHITAQQYEFAEREVYICIFIRHGFKPADIAALLNISSQLTTNLRTRINQKLFGASGTKHLDDNIIKLYL